MSTVTQKVPKQQIATGVFTPHDEDGLEKKLILVFGPKTLVRRESLAQECYRKALQECTSCGFLSIISDYSISNCWDNRRAVFEAIINNERTKNDIHPTTHRMLVSIGERNGFGEYWATFINGFDIKAASSPSTSIGQKRVAPQRRNQKKARTGDETATLGGQGKPGWATDGEYNGNAEDNVVNDRDVNPLFSNLLRMDPSLHVSSAECDSSDPLVIRIHDRQVVNDRQVEVPRDNMPQGVPSVGMEFAGKKILDSITEFDGRMMRILYQAQPSTLDNMTPETRSLWEKSTTSQPRILRAEQCWNPHPPTTKELVIATLDCFDKSGDKPSYTVFSREERDDGTDPKEAIAQLIDPNPINPIFLTGLRLSMLAKSLFRTPIELSTFVEPYEENNIQLNLTPKYSFVDLHIDYGTDGVSAPIGKCVKVWVMYPPTARNLTLMQSAEGQKAKLTRIGPFLEGGVISNTTSAEAIYLPAGCIHATFTIEGGYLIATDFTTMDSAKVFSAYIACGMDNSLGSAGQRDCFNWFAKCLDVTLVNKRGGEALKAWINAVDRLEDRARSDSRWCAKVEKVWKSFLSSRPSFLDPCPCGGMLATQALRAHLKSTHLSFLYPKSMEIKRKKRNA